jgi:hypothetical protein
MSEAINVFSNLLLFLGVFYVILFAAGRAETRSNRSISQPDADVNRLRKTA